MPPKVKPVKDTSTANLGFEQKLWLTADSRGEAEAKRSEGGPARFLQIPGHTAEGNRSNAMDAAEPSAARQTVRSTARRVSEANQYKHVVLGLIFLKYISDTFEEHRAKCLADQGDYAGANAEDPDEPSGANRSAVERAEQTLLHTQRGKQTAKGSPQGERGGVHQFGVSPMTALAR